MEQNSGKTQDSFARLKAWLSSNHTLTLPGWAYAAAGGAASILLLIALD